LIFEPFEPLTAIIRGALCLGKFFIRIAPAFSLIFDNSPERLLSRV
jgi:hypothetical protein